ncbi:hypothetical protein [Streptomyces sp. E5N298]|uniref:hypothetical protein n=1 Tax=Streptomyces sp. E5N298 TaxID=1851983 RepID=UPI000EF5C650|nr:hypothetical protein [Streptomyces sp. E5N298]
MTIDQNEAMPASTLADLQDANTLLRRREHAVRELIAIHIAQGLDSRDGDRWRAAISLTQALDKADCNVDQLVDQWLEDHGWDPRAAYKALPAPGATDDPWAEPQRPTAREPWGPGITREEAMAHVVTLHLAEALLDGKSEEVRTWARGLAHELKREQIDLIDDIGRHMQHMALGGPTSEVPF